MHAKDLSRKERNITGKVGDERIHLTDALLHAPLHAPLRKT